MFFVKAIAVKGVFKWEGMRFLFMEIYKGYPPPNMWHYGGWEPLDLHDVIPISATSIQIETTNYWGVNS